MSRLIPLAALILGFACQSVLGQEAKPQPVARLITSITPVTKVSMTSAPVEPNEIERRAFEQTNAARIQHGLPPFVWDSDVCRMARIHSEKMSRQGFSLTSRPTDWVCETGFALPALRSLSFLARTSLTIRATTIRSVCRGAMDVIVQAPRQHSVS